MDAAFWRSGGVFVSVAFVGLAILRHDLVVDVHYRPAKVVQVQYLPHLGFNWRAVLVDFGDDMRVIRTDARYLTTDIGAKVCIAERKFLLRRFTRYALALRSQCPGLKVLSGPADGVPAMLPGD